MPEAIVCKYQDCARLMPLPEAKQLHPERASWPDVYPGFFAFLCAVCGHAYVYSVSDVVTIEAVKINRNEDGSPRKVQNVVCISIPCWSSACSEKTIFQGRGSVQVETLMPFDLNLLKFIGDPSNRQTYYQANLEMAAEKLIGERKCVAHGIPCSSGCNNGNITKGEEIRVLRPIYAELDKRWKSQPWK